MWQKDNRDIRDDHCDFATHVNRMKQASARYGHTWMVSKLEEEAELTRRAGSWREEREWQRNNLREDHGDGGFLEYNAAVKRRLERHGFTRRFQLEEDPERRDKLTTWIEYLNYEYWWYDAWVSRLKRRQPYYDRQWKELVDSKLLRPFETESFVLSEACAIQHASERSAAQEAVKHAKSAALATLELVQEAWKDQRNSNLDEPERKRLMIAAKIRLDSAKAALKLIRRRNGLVDKFHVNLRQYKIMKKDSERHEILLRWILDQVPLIETELNKTEVTGSISVDDTTPLIQTRAQPKRSNNQLVDEVPPHKRMKKGG